MLGTILGVKKYADYENMIADRISRHLGVIPITSMPLWVALSPKILPFSIILSGVSSVMSTKVGLG